MNFRKIGGLVDVLFEKFSLKVGVISILLFSLFFHFVFPYIYFYFNGFFSVYLRPSMLLFDGAAYHKAFFLNVGGLALGALGIYFMPDAKRIVPGPRIRSPHLFFVVASLLTIAIYISAGGAQGILLGKANGTFLNYLGIFFERNTAFIMTVAYFQNASPLFMGLFVIFVSIVSGSRSAPIVLFINFCLLMGVGLSKAVRLRFILLILFSFIFSLHLYRLASYSRIVDFGNGAQIADNTDVKGPPSLIVGRISFLETGMLPIIHKDRHDLRHKLSVFYDKYSFSNQISFFKNYFFPRRIKFFLEENGWLSFNRDPLPNQFYRAIFLSEPIDSIAQRYTSINITFPVYLYMYFGFWFALVGYAVALWVIYLTMYFASQRSRALTFIVGTSLYNFIYFFDFADLYIGFQRGALTTVCFLIFYSLAKNIFRQIGRLKDRKLEG